MNSLKRFIPVTLIRGFLDAGKSTLINRLAQDGTLCPEKEDILLLSCEEGETAYDGTCLNQKNITVIELEDESRLSREYLEHLDALYAPKRVILECNAMWNLAEFELPQNWKAEKRIAVLCGPTLGLYLDNMRAFLGPMLSRCNQIFINRCDSGGPGMLSPVKAKLRPLLDDTSAVIIESQGSLYTFDDIRDILPYALEADPVVITPENYVCWFYDCQDHQNRYEGRRISMDASVKKSPVLGTGGFALGRIAITCCEADMEFLGYIAHYDLIDSIPQFAHVHVEVMVRYRFMQNYNAVMPYLEVLRMEPLNPDNSIVTF